MDDIEALLASVNAGEVEIILDLSRLLSRCLHSTPSGVDRVEMAYARQLERLLLDRLAFAAVHPSGAYGRLPRQSVRRFLDETEARWTSHTLLPRWKRYLLATRTLIRLLPRRVPRRTARRYYVQASPNHLDRDAVVEAKLRREQAEFICLVHDLIPIEFPEYARPGGAAKHAVRMATLAKHARALLANSVATAESMRRFLADQLHKPPVFPVLLGTDDLTPAARSAAPPYFLILGTIEPRKNHILLLNIWRRMIELHGADGTPNLIVAGRRGWENEHVIDMLERTTSIKGHVRELGNSSDDELASLICNARALLLPSFAEGFGMPVAEALAAGTPVICSDLPALREVGGEIPDYIDPLDGMAWMAAIRDYARTDSKAREAQLARLPSVELPTWDSHVRGVLGIIADLDRNRAGLPS